MRVLLLSFALIAIVFAAKLRFDGESVLKVNLTSNRDIEKFKDLFGNDFDSVDLWTESLFVGENHVRCNQTICKMLAKNFHTSLFIQDVQHLIEQENIIRPGADWFGSYHSYAEIQTFCQALSASYPNLVTWVPSIGQTIEGRNIFALRIFGGQMFDDTPRIYVQGGQHAREWIGPATTLFILNQLLTDYSNANQEVRTLLSEIEFVFVPLVNADGYEYSRSTNRLWRKNRRQNTGSSYWGVDLNRNWDILWGQGEGSSPNPSSDVYRGTGPFSEPETAATSSFLKNLPNVIGAVDYHAYSQLILRPYGWKTGNSPDESSLKALGTAWSASIKKSYGISYTSQKSAELYLTDGSASDWFYDIGIYGSFTIELRDTGTYGFVLPAVQIIPTGQENYNGFLVFANAVFEHDG